MSWKSVRRGCKASVAQQSGQTIYTSVLTQPEIVSALQRRVREGPLRGPPGTAARAASRGAHDTIVYTRGDHAPNLTQACALLQRHPLRAYDALHLACALAIREAIAQQQLPHRYSLRQTTRSWRRQLPRDFRSPIRSSTRKRTRATGIAEIPLHAEASASMLGGCLSPLACPRISRRLG